MLATRKVNAREAGAGVKESGFIQRLATWKVGDSCLKAHLPISVGAEVLQGGRGEQNKEIKGGVHKVLYVQMSTVTSHEASDGLERHPGFIILASRHLSFTSSWLHGGRSANPPELGCLKVGVCIF